VVDYGDCSFDYARHAEIPGCIEAQARDIIDAGPMLISIGGDHYVTCAAHRPCARHVRWAGAFDAHQDTCRR